MRAGRGKGSSLPLGSGLLALVSLGLSLAATELAIRQWVPVRDVGPPLSEYDPVYGKRLRPSRVTRRVHEEFVITVTTNSRGRRGPESQGGDRDGVLFLGDSFTMGYGVDDGREFPALVRETLRPCGVPVVNAGIGDTGNGRWLRFLRREAGDLDPRLIVLQFSSNDFADNEREDFFRRSDDGGLVAQPIPPLGLRRWLMQTGFRIPGLEYSHLVGLARQLLHRSARAQPVRPPEPTGAPRADARELTWSILAAVGDYCEAREWPVAILLADLPADLRARFRERFPELRFLVIPSKAEQPDLYYRKDGHWNPAGHVLAATRTLQAIREAGIAPHCLDYAAEVTP